MGVIRYVAVLLGANWDNAGNSGSRSANWNNSPSNSNGNVSARGLSDDKQTPPPTQLRLVGETYVVSRMPPPSGNTSRGSR